MMNKRIPLLIAFLLLVTNAMTVSAQDEPKRAITQVAGDVYRFQNNFHFGLVVITDEGVVVADPINADAASWLKTELTTLTDKPITHLIYSHSHGDHASGGEVLAEGAEVLTQANAPKAIDGVVPTIRFDDEHSFQIGDKTIELKWLGPGHGVDLIAAVVRPENVAFITDAASPKRLPFRDMGGANVDDWINQIKTIESLDFEIFAPAHGSIGVKSDAQEVRVYMEKLREEVLTGLKAGKSVDDLAGEITMADYKDWSQYEEWLSLNIEGMAKFLIKSDQVN